MNNDERIPQLLYKRIIGQISDEEQAELMEWANANGSNRKTYEELSDTTFLEKEYHKRNAVDYHRALESMKKHAESTADDEHRVSIKTITMRIINIAAVVVLIAGAYIYYHNTFATDKGKVISMVLPGDSIQHGTTQATLTLDNGQTVALGSDTKHNAELLAKLADGATTQQLQLTTPRGGEFKIVLEDGTEVWLNAESQLRYPEKFGTDQRHVEITGEAYFKVAKDASRPFYVETAGQIVRVLGTEFNVHSYADEASVLTTLINGSIAMMPAESPNAELRLTPGHQASFSKSAHDITVKSVNVEDVTGWKNGVIVFNDQNLSQIMKTLSRWYDFDYRFADQQAAKAEFAGQVTRYDNFDDVCHIIEKCGGIKIERHGKTVTIKSN